MPSPNFDELHARFSRAIEDPVAVADVTAGTDTPIKVSSAVRSDYLNRATREFLAQAYLMLGPEGMRKLFQAMVIIQTPTFASGGTAVGADYLELPIDLTRDSYTDVFVYWPAKSDLDNIRNVHLDHAFAVEAGKIYAYADYAQITSGTGKFYYIGYTDLTANASTDTALPKAFWDIVVDMAVMLYLTEVNKTDEPRGERIRQALMGLKALL